MRSYIILTLMNCLKLMYLNLCIVKTYKTCIALNNYIIFHVVLCLFNNRSQMMSKCGKHKKRTQVDS